MEYTKPFRRRLWVFGAATLVAIAGCALAWASVDTHLAAVAEASDAERRAARARIGFERARALAESAAGPARFQDEPDRLSALEESVEETLDAAHELAERTRAAGLDEEAGLLEEDLRSVAAALETVAGAAEAVDGARARRLHELAAELETATATSAEAGYALSTLRTAEAERSGSATRAGVLLAALGVGLALLGMLLVLLEMLNEAFRPSDLEGEVRALSGMQEVGARVERLARKRSLADPDRALDEWTLALERVVSRRRTHTVFEAVATAKGATLLLLGRRYHWTGQLKGVQRLGFPAFGRSTWLALWAMHGRGLEAPVPIVWRGLRARRLPAGSLLLLEHLGPLTPVRRFVSAELGLLAEPERARFVERLAAFLSELRAAGIRGISPRGIHGRGLASSEPRFYLCDLDKVHPEGGRLPRPLRRLLERIERRRVRATLGPYLRPEERARLDRVLAPRG